MHKIQRVIKLTKKAHNLQKKIVCKTYLTIIVYVLLVSNNKNYLEEILVEKSKLKLFIISSKLRIKLIAILWHKARF